MLLFAVLHAAVAVLTLALAVKGDFLQSYGQVGPPEGHETLDILVSLSLTGSDHGQSMALAAYYAADLINMNTSLLPGRWIVLHVIDDMCASQTAVQRTLTEYFEEGRHYVAIGGLGCGETAKSLARIGDSMRVPVVSWGASLGELSDRTLFPRFFRTRTPEGDVGRFQVLLCQMFAWRKVALVKGDQISFGRDAANFKSLAASNNIAVVMDRFLMVDGDEDLIFSKLVELRTRIVMMYTYETSINLLLCASIKAGAFGFVLSSTITADRFWFGVDSTPGNQKCTADAMQAQLNGHVQIGGVSLRPDTGVPWGCYPGMTVQDLSDWWDNRKNQKKTGLVKFSDLAFNAADGVCLMAKALAGLLDKNYTVQDLSRNPAVSTYHAFTDMIANVAFEGASGRIAFPLGSGDPIGKLVVKQMIGSATVVLGYFDPGKSVMTWERMPKWPGNASKVTDSIAPCPVGSVRSVHRVSECDLCEPGTYNDEAGNVRCTVCPEGSRSEKWGEGKCTQCPVGLESNLRFKATSCLECSFLYTSLVDEPCRFQPSELIPVAVQFLLIWVVTCLIFILVNVKIKICDITPCHDTGCVRVILFEPHHLDYTWRNGTSTCVSLHGTGCEALDGWGKNLRAKVVGGHTFELLDSENRPIKDPELESSGGFLMVPLANLVLDTTGWLRKVPVMLFIIVSLAISVIMLVVRKPLSVSEALVISSCAFACGLICVLLQRCRGISRRTPIGDCIHKYRKELKKDVPAPVSSDRGPGRAVSIESLQLLMRTFEKFIQSRNTYYLCTNIVLPVTQPYHLSLAEVIGPKQATWFASHCWGGKFRDTIKSLDHHAGLSRKMGVMECNYWVCTFSNNQWSIESEMGEGVTTSSFYLALRSESVRGTAMIVSIDVLPFQRVWCLLEASISCDQSHVNSEFKGLLLCTPAGVLNSGQGTVETGYSLVDQLVYLDMRSAKATRQVDKDMILNFVEQMDGGLEQVNRLVATGILQSFNEMHQSFESSFLEIQHRATTIVERVTIVERDVSSKHGRCTAEHEASEATPMCSSSASDALPAETASGFVPLSSAFRLPGSGWSVPAKIRQL